MNPTTHPYFVPDGDSRVDTAVLLTGTAREFGIDTHAIHAASGGFYITEELLDAMDNEPDGEPAPDSIEEVVSPEPTATPKPRGKNAAASNTAPDKE